MSLARWGKWSEKISVKTASHISGFQCNIAIRNSILQNQQKYIFLYVLFIISEILQLVKRCNNLRELDLSDSTVLTCNSIHHISHYLKRLEYIALSRCYRISPTSVP